MLYISQQSLAGEVSAAIASCGFIDCGPTRRDDLFFLNETEMPAISARCERYGPPAAHTPTMRAGPAAWPAALGWEAELGGRPTIRFDWRNLEACGRTVRLW